jgi:hypothetical protein
MYDQADFRSIRVCVEQLYTDIFGLPILVARVAHVLFVFFLIYTCKECPFQPRVRRALSSSPVSYKKNPKISLCEVVWFSRS